jgi:hypothetical protein
MPTFAWSGFPSVVHACDRLLVQRGHVPVTDQLVPLPTRSSFGASMVLQRGHGSRDAANSISVPDLAFAAGSLTCPVRR